MSKTAKYMLGIAIVGLALSLIGLAIMYSCI